MIKKFVKKHWKVVAKVFGFATFLCVPYFMFYCIGIFILSLLALVRPSKCELVYVPFFFDKKKQLEEWYLAL